MRETIPDETGSVEETIPHEGTRPDQKTIPDEGNTQDKRLLLVSMDSGFVFIG